MRRTILVLLFLGSINAFAQLNCGEDLLCKVIAKSGMKIRAEPSLQSKVVAAVPYDSLLTACRETFGSMSYEDIHGYWRKVHYQGKTGYMFDGYIEVIKILEDTAPKKDSLNPAFIDTMASDDSGADTSGISHLTDTIHPEEVIPLHTPTEVVYNIITEAYNYCGDVTNIDPGLLWYGVYPATDEEPFYRVMEVEVDILLSKERLGKGMEFDIETSNDEKSIFLIGINRPLPLKNDHIPDNSDKLRSMSRKLFPGQELTLAKVDRKAVKLSATGSVISSGDCPEMENYRLMLSGEKYFLPVQQDLLTELKGPGKCGMPDVYWYGDLNGDSYPEIILVSVYEDKNIFTLLVSDSKLDDRIVRKEAEWIIDKCY